MRIPREDFTAFGSSRSNRPTSNVFRLRVELCRVYADAYIGHSLFIVSSAPKKLRRILCLENEFNAFLCKNEAEPAFVNVCKGIRRAIGSGNGKIVRFEGRSCRETGSRRNHVNENVKACGLRTRKRQLGSSCHRLR